MNLQALDMLVCFMTPQLLKQPALAMVRLLNIAAVSFILTGVVNLICIASQRAQVNLPIDKEMDISKNLV